MKLGGTVPLGLISSTNNQSTYELFNSRIFLLIFLDYSQLWVTGD